MTPALARWLNSFDWGSLSGRLVLLFLPCQQHAGRCVALHTTPGVHPQEKQRAGLTPTAERRMDNAVHALLRAAHLLSVTHLRTRQPPRACIVLCRSQRQVLPGLWRADAHGRDLHTQASTSTRPSQAYQSQVAHKTPPPPLLPQRKPPPRRPQHPAHAAATKTDMASKQCAAAVPAGGVSPRRAIAHQDTRDDHTVAYQPLVAAAAPATSTAYQPLVAAAAPATSTAYQPLVAAAAPATSTACWSACCQQHQPPALPASQPAASKQPCTL